MKTSDIWNYKSMAGKITMGLVLAAMIGSMDVASALEDHGRYHDNGPRGRGYERHHMRMYPYGYRERGYERHHMYMYPYGHRGYRHGPPPVIYAPPLYAPPPIIYAPPPPPVIYAPPPRPGISIFFPPIFIHP